MFNKYKIYVVYLVVWVFKKYFDELVFLFMFDD